MSLLVCDFPLVKTAISRLRDKNTEHTEFRRNVRYISRVLALEVSKQFSLNEYQVQTPLETTIGFRFEKEVILLPILRAGLGMLDGFLDIIPSAKAGHIGLQRNEVTLQPEKYYFKIPEISDPIVIILDPMLATGGSASAAISKVKHLTTGSVYLISIISAPEGVKKVETDFPDIQIYTATLDRELNNKGYILPGLGDAGDRIFGT